jgi:hypothetical protein
MQIPALNRNLTADERRAVARSFARDAARETVREEGAVRVDMDRVEAEALVLLLFDWVEQALQPEEAAP